MEQVTYLHISLEQRWSWMANGVIELVGCAAGRRPRVTCKYIHTSNQLYVHKKIPPNYLAVGAVWRVLRHRRGPRASRLYS